MSCVMVSSPSLLHTTSLRLSDASFLHQGSSSRLVKRGSWRLMSRLTRKHAWLALLAKPVISRNLQQGN